MATRQQSRDWGTSIVLWLIALTFLAVAIGVMWYCQAQYYPA